MDVPDNGDKLNTEQQEQLLFMMLIQQHQQIAMMGLGKIKNPSTDKIERDLSSAKFAIDTLNMLQKFTSGNLPKELENYITQTLTTLRLNYADEKKKDGTEEKETGPENPSDKKSQGGENAAAKGKEKERKKDAGKNDSEDESD
ncbi:MAG: DUF1844 domain-containing protein [Balneolaceae bacterium]